MIYARPRRPIVRLAALAAGLGLACALGAGGALWEAEPLGVVAGLAGAAAGALALSAWVGWRALRWPPARLCLFRDRILLVRGRTVATALWDRLEVVTLAVPRARREASALPDVRLGDRLTLGLRAPHPPLTFRPPEVGMEPVGCRDLILRLRDDPAERAGLPEFDSALDLRGRPLTAGELNRRS